MYSFNLKIKENPCSPLNIELKSHLTLQNTEFLYMFLKNISSMNSSMKKSYCLRNKSQLNATFYL